MHITINGESHTFDAPATLTEMLDELGLDARRVAIERNKALVHRQCFDLTALTDGDEIEIVTLVGGG